MSNPNHLIHESSPYLLQHARNPVEWYPWGPEALAKAKAEDKPIFLSIGYAACHWCHVQLHESFENPDIAALMNEYFVNIKVDREERPDLDSIYMDAVVALTGHGGWPMSVFLIPDGTPFYGGTYFPPQPRGGMPGFPDVLRGYHEAWVSRRESVLEGGQDLLKHIQQSEAAGQTGGEPLSPDTLLEAVKNLWTQFDWRQAGWGGAPKFPQPMTIEFLLRHHARTGDALALEMATKTLDAMLRGGMYDHLGGGFHRYATDAVWLVPHFEKMLYDNSQLARVYLHAWQVTHKPEYKRVVAEILDYVLREMTDAGGGASFGPAHPRPTSTVGPGGGFYSTQDADSEGVEGKFFVWDEKEIDSLLGAESPLFKARYGVTARGNFEHRNILFIAAEVDTLARQFDLPVEEVERKLAMARQILFDAREKRIHPGLDDKVLSGWNGLMLAAFAEAARFWGAPTIGLRLWPMPSSFGASCDPTGRLYRSWRKGEAKLNGYLEDYAAAAEGLLALYETTFEPRWFTAAQELMESVLTHFVDPQGGFFDTSDEHEALVVRPKSIQDNAVPSGSSLAVTVLLKLVALTGETRYADLAETMLRQVQPILPRYPTGFGQWLAALSFSLGEVKEIAIVGELNAAETQAMLSIAWGTYQPFQVVAVGGAESPLPLLNDRRQIEGKTTAYVCHHFACHAPVTEIEAFKLALEQRPG